MRQNSIVFKILIQFCIFVVSYLKNQVVDLSTNRKEKKSVGDAATPTERLGRVGNFWKIVINPLSREDEANGTYF